VSNQRGKQIPFESFHRESQNRLLILFHCRDISSDAAEAESSLFTPESLRHFLLQFDHPDLPFSLIIREWDREIVHEQKGSPSGIFGNGQWGFLPLTASYDHVSRASQRDLLFHS